MSVTFLFEDEDINDYDYCHLRGCLNITFPVSSLVPLGFFYFFASMQLVWMPNPAVPHIGSADI